MGHHRLVDLGHRVLTVLRWSEQGYVQTATVGEKLAAEPFDEVELDVGTLFGVD